MFILGMGVALALITIAAVGAYTIAEVRRLRDEQTTISAESSRCSSSGRWVQAVTR